MFFKSIVAISLFVLLFSILYNAYCLVKIPELPKLENEWWGPGEAIINEDDQTINPHLIEITQESLDDLKLRLNITRPFTPAFESLQHQYGLNTKIVSEVLNYLKTEYNFKERQAYLNKYPQYTTKIQGLKIHFLHVKPDTVTNATIYPILLLHGWPSSVREFYELIPTLTNPQSNVKFAFDVVAPSIPGFGYSEGSYKANCRAPQMAVIMKNLMNRLGYKKFYVHGSDWGSLVAADMAVLYPQNVLGYHSNFCFSLRYSTIFKIIFGSIAPSWFIPTGYESKLYPIYKTLIFYLQETGYFHIQATKPDTIGVALENSIEGMISFMLEKLSIGTNRNYIYKENAGLLDKYDYSKLLDIIIFYYWIPKSSTTAARIYAENFNIKSLTTDLHNNPIDPKVPCGCAFFEHEFLYQPVSMLEDKFSSLIQYNQYKVGGHFAALEESELLVNDMISFVSKAEKLTKF